MAKVSQVCDAPGTSMDTNPLPTAKCGHGEGNESLCSKIDWSEDERKASGLLSEDHLDSAVDTVPPGRAPEVSKMQNKGPRGSCFSSARPSNSSKNSRPPARLPAIGQLPKAYVATGEDTTSGTAEKKTTELSAPVSNADASAKSTLPRKNVAKKHTHPVMRLANNVPKTKATKTAKEAVPAEEPAAAAKTSSNVNLPKVMEMEKEKKKKKKPPTELELIVEELSYIPTTGRANLVIAALPTSIRKVHSATCASDLIPDDRYILPDDVPQSDKQPTGHSGADASVGVGSSAKSSHQFASQTIAETLPQEKSVFPNVVTAEIVTLQVGGKATRCMKIVFEATTGQHQEPGPSGVELALPVPNIDDRWVIVALDLVPNLGLLVPGLSTFISAEFLGRAASTAVVHQCKVRYPIIYQLENDEDFQPGCGVCATPQLPRHVFVGPFSANLVAICVTQRCMKLITLTQPAQSDSACSNSSSSTTTTPAPRPAPTPKCNTRIGYGNWHTPSTSSALPPAARYNANYYSLQVLPF